MVQLLQNIKKVEYIETHYMKDLVLLSNKEVSLQYWRNFTELCLDGLGSVEVSQNVENGSRLTTVKLTVHTRSEIFADSYRLCWRVTTVEGKQYLIGINEQPYPVTTVNDNFPEKPTERSGKTVTVLWRTCLELLEIKE